MWPPQESTKIKYFISETQGTCCDPTTYYYFTTTTADKLSKKDCLETKTSTPSMLIINDDAERASLCSCANDELGLWMAES